MDITKVNANPSRAFFVTMLTRDIATLDCIFDLIDNSVDGAWHHAGVDPSSLTADSALGEYWVDVTIAPNEFQIRDNCGGITLDDAVHYAFTFGRDPEQESDGFSVGVYGIGMKRAVFKLGSGVHIRSTCAGEAPASFEVPINVKEWVADRAPVWDFDLLESDPLNEPGVAIRVTELNRQTQRLFDNSEFVRKLRRHAARDYMIPLLRGLKLTINGTQIEAPQINFMESAAIKTMFHEYTEEDVQVRIVAGATRLFGGEEPTTNAEDYDGWHVVCNGRVVLFGDKSALTGWGDGLPKWHPQYSGFTGFLFFAAENAALLPMTTTKRNVDPDTSVYVSARANIKEPTRAWTKFTNASKKLDERERVAFEQSATPVPLLRVEPAPFLTMPDVTPGPDIQVANINYSVPLRRLRDVAEALGDRELNYREVGVRSFDFAYEALVTGKDET